jgi:hypothetical protein
MRALREMLGTAFGFVGGVLILYGVALWGWQIYRWLDRGEWFPLPAILTFQNLNAIRTLAAASSDPLSREHATMLSYLPQFPRPEWMDHPRQWAGMHQAVMWVLDNAHVGACAAAIGVMFVVLGAWFLPSRRMASMGDAYR